MNILKNQLEVTKNFFVINNKKVNKILQVSFTFLFALLLSFESIAKPIVDSNALTNSTIDEVNKKFEGILGSSTILLGWFLMALGLFSAALFFWKLFNKLKEQQQARESWLTIIAIGILALVLLGSGLNSIGAFAFIVGFFNNPNGKGTELLPDRVWDK